MEILTLCLGLVLGLVLGLLAAVALGTPGARGRRPSHQQTADQAVLREGLERLHDQLRDLDHQRATWQGQLAQQVLDMRHTTDLLRRETQSLATALRRPHVRGRWGELHLRRAVEIAGMVAHCDFTEQTRLADGALRPDLVVRLAGGRHLVVDAKVPLDAYLDAGAADDDDQREQHLRRHAAQLRQHVDALGAKRYWRALPESPEFVVMFLPAESFLGGALDLAPDLLEYAAARQVVLATPTTLIALLRTVAHGWSHETLAEQAREIHGLGRDLHDRLSTLTGHVDALGRSLNAAVGHYNQTVGSFEARVLVCARRFSDLGVTGDDLPSPRQVDSVARSVEAVPLRSADRRGAHGDDTARPSVAL